MIDDALVITGSFNFTRSASERNFENVLVLQSAGAAKAYRDEFFRVWNEHG